jgi:hypothetical protein
MEQGEKVVKIKAGFDRTCAFTSIIEFIRFWKCLCFWRRGFIENRGRLFLGFKSQIGNWIGWE